MTNIGPLKPNSEHIHASDKYILIFISVRSFTGHNRVKCVVLEMLSHLKGFNLSNSKLINMLLICYWGEDQIQSPFALLHVCWDPPQRQQSLCLGDIRNYPVAEFIIMSCHKNSHKYSSQIVTQNRGKGTEYWRRPATVLGCITWLSLWGQCMDVGG